MGHFVIRETNERFTFRLRARNGEVIATSQVYANLASCEKGIASVMKNAPIAAVEDRTKDRVETAACPKFEIYLDKTGEFYFRLIGPDGESIAASQGYTALASCKKGIESVRSNAANASIETEITE